MRDKFAFCQSFMRLKGQPMSFDERPYLLAIYASTARRLVIRASRQVEKTQFLVNTIMHAVVQHPGIHIVCVFPRREQGDVFSSSRLTPVVYASPVLRRLLIGRGRRPKVENLRFSNNSEIYIRAAYHSADAARGIDGDILLVDEFQDIADGDLPVLEECLSHSDMRKVILTGTPKTIDNHLEGVFSRSTGHEWLLPCARCQKGIILDDQCIGQEGLVCPTCRTPLRVADGTWVPRNPTATWGDGFWINHLMVPWVKHDELLDKQRVYDPARFRNEVLGLPTSLGDHVVTRAEMEACCGDYAMAGAPGGIDAGGELFMGIDWGGGVSSRTVMVLGRMRADFVFEVLRIEHFTAGEEPDRILNEVAQRCQAFGVQWIVADGAGNGHHFNRMLLERIRPCWPVHLYAIFYSASEQPPRPDGVLVKWTVNRSGSIGALFTRVKKQSIRFPRVQDCGNYLDEFACEIAEYDEYQHSIKYVHPATQRDDALHATNYGLLLAIHRYQAQAHYG